MPSLLYLNFDLHFERAGEAYNVFVLDAPAGQAAASFQLPFTDLELENYLLRFARVAAPVRRLESPEMRAAKHFGGKLFNAVFVGDVRGVWRASLDEAARQERGLRLRLFLDKTPELCDLPWEFLYNASVNRFLALSTKTPLVRFLNLPETARPLRISPPLRILTIISSPIDFEPLSVQQERTKLDGALGELQRCGLVALEFMAAPTLGALQRHLRRKEYHILHFIGHGNFNRNVQDGELIFEDEQRRGRRVSGQDLGMLLHDHDSLRLAVLNTCEGARSSRSDPFAGVAQSLVQQGIPAVIAMQFAISDEAAIMFSQEFYRALADGYPVDSALTEARKTIFAQDNEVEWATPVLYMRSSDGRLFDWNKSNVAMAETVAPVEKAATLRAPNVSPARHFAFGVLGSGIALLCSIFLFLGNAWQQIFAWMVVPTPTPTFTWTPTPIQTPTLTQTFTATVTKTWLPRATRPSIHTATATLTPTVTASHTATATATASSTPTATASSTPTATATHTATFTPTRAKTHTPLPTPTNTVAPGVYVIALRASPAAPHGREFVTFYATFLNTTASVQTVSWLVQIFDSQTSVAYGETQKQTIELPPGEHEIASAQNWRAGIRMNECFGLYARAFAVHATGVRFPLMNPMGDVATVNLYICP